MLHFSNNFFYECYAPNTAARILDEEGNIVKINNNYAQISFNFGPTLLSWMQKADPDAYEAIIKADQHSKALFSGEGSGVAQVYNHKLFGGLKNLFTVLIESPRACG